MTKTLAEITAEVTTAITSNGLRENTGARVGQAVRNMLAREGQPNGYASLDASGAVPSSQIEGAIVFSVADLTAAKALSSPRVGDLILIGGSRGGSFEVVDDDTLGSDGGTVFIPNSELSAIYEEVIPNGTFSGATDANVAMEYDLDHTDIDLESVEVVLTDGGETITGWELHGHTLSPITAYRADTPQLPLIDTARGKFRDPYGALTGYATRTGGLLLRYKYATSGLRLKRVTGDRFDLRWWPVTATVDEVGPQVDNTDYICWANNAAALAGAGELYFHDKYHYSHSIEQPDGVAWVGRSAVLSGIRVMDGEGYSELLLSKSTAPDPAVHPGTSAYTIWFKYQHFFKNYTPTVSAASGAMRLTLEDIFLDGNMDNNLGYWTDQSLYASDYVDGSSYFHNSPFYTGYSVSNHSNRPIPEGQKVFIKGHVRIIGYGGGNILGNDQNRVVQTGLLEVGDCLHNHWLYRVDGEYDNLHCLGYCNGDGIRAANMVIKNLYIRPTQYPTARFDFANSLKYDAQTVNFTIGATLTGGTSGATAVISGQADTGATGRLYIKSVVGTFQNNEIITDSSGGSATADGVVTSSSAYPSGATILPITFAFPGFPHINWGQTNESLALPVHQFICDNLYMDLSPMDDPVHGWRQGCIPITLAGDNFQIRSGRIRGWQSANILTVYLTYANGFQFGPYRNVYSNFSIETPSRAGVTLFASNLNDGGFHNATFIHPIEPLAATPVPETAAPAGVHFTLGTLRFSQVADGYDGWGIDFSAATAVGLGGDYIDIDPVDTGVLPFRVWFDYNNSSSAPSGTGVTLIEVNIGVGATPDAIAQAAATAIRANATAFSYINAYSHPVRTPTTLVLGSHTLHRSYPAASGILAVDVTNATGVTKAQRAHQRFYEKSIINFEDSDWASPTPAGLISIPGASFGANRDITLNFRRCVVGAFTFPYVRYATSGSLASADVIAIKDRLHLNFEDCAIHFRGDAGIFPSPLDMDLFFYASKLRNCRIVTDDATLGELKSEDFGEYSWVADGVAATVDIPTALGWGPKVFRVEPADAATMAIWTANNAFATYRLNGGTALGGTGAYYQGPDSQNEDRRKPALRVTFAAAPGAATYKFRWYGAISP